MNKKPIVLMILDGYGLNEKTNGNAVAIAKTPDKNSQKILPAPPINIAVATPIIFPVPSVPARTVIKDLNELIPSCVFLLSPFIIYFNPLKVFNCGNFNFIVKKICVNIKITIKGIPQTKFSTLKIIFFIHSP